MKTDFYRILSVLFIFILNGLTSSALFSQTTEIITDYSLRDRSYKLLTKPDTTEYRLPHKFIEAGSELILSGKDSLRRNIDYELDYDAGIIKMILPAADRPVLEITYRVNQPFETIVERHWEGFMEIEEDSSNADTSAVSSVPEAETARLKRPDKLRTRGSLVRGFRIGSNEGFSLNSGLRLQIDGEIAKGINLVASMTDQNTPIQPEGNTQTLREIDKVFVGLTGENFDFKLGDIGVNFDDSNFLNYRRKLQGGVSSARIGSTELRITGAVARGKFRTLSINGIESNQGPYKLTGENGISEVFIIAGSEKVYIDGQQMIRGETRDYVIDYSNAELTFTPYRLITSDSRILIDYEYSDRSYNRSVIASEASTEVYDGNILIGGRYVRESDDRNHPIGTDFNEKEIFALANSGDESAFIDGGTNIGIGQGAYIKIFNPELGDSVYRYVGQDTDGSFKGSWSVIFTRVGEGNGDYDNRIGDSLLVSPEGNFYFEYRGSGMGSFVAKKLLRTPITQSTSIFHVKINPTGRLQIQSELGMSRKDGNSFSSIGDNDNNGNAFIIRGTYNGFKSGDRGVKVDAKFRRITENFNRIDRIDEIEFNRKWNLPDSLSGTEFIAESGIHYKGKSRDEVYGRYGRLEIERKWNTNRFEAGGRKSVPVLGNIFVNQEFLSSGTPDKSITSKWLRRKGRLEKQINAFTPSIGFESEDKEDTDSTKTGFMYLEYFIGLKADNFGAVNTFIEYRERNDEQYVNAISEPRSKAISKTVGIELQSSKSLSTTIRISRRTRDFKGIFRDDLQDTRSNLVALRSNYRPLEGALRITVDYRAASELTAGQERVYLRVEEGRGQFRFDDDTNEYVPDVAGDFILRTRQTGIYEPVTDLRSSVRITIKPKRKAGRRRRIRENIGFWRSITVRTHLRIDEKSKDPDTRSLLLLNNSKLRNSKTTILGSLLFEEDVILLEKRNGSSLRLRYRYFEELNNQFITGSEERLTREASFRWRNTSSEQTRFDFEGSRSLTIKNFDSRFRRDREVVSSEFSFNVSHLPNRKVEIGSKFGLGWDRDLKRSDELKATLRELELRNNYFLRGRGMIRLLAGWANVGVSPKGAPITYEMANGFKEGNNYRWSVGLDYRLGTNLNASLTYEGRNESGRRTRHIGRAEVRAWF